MSQLIEVIIFEKGAIKGKFFLWEMRIFACVIDKIPWRQYKSLELFNDRL